MVQDRLENYALHIEALSQHEQKWIDVDRAGAELGLSAFESRKMADLLEDNRWITTIQVGRDQPPKLRLTRLGFEEIPQLRWGWLRRWLYRSPAIAISAAALLLSVATFVFK